MFLKINFEILLKGTISRIFETKIQNFLSKNQIFSKRKISNILSMFQNVICFNKMIFSKKLAQETFSDKKINISQENYFRFFLKSISEKSESYFLNVIFKKYSLGKI